MSDPFSPSYSLSISSDADDYMSAEVIHRMVHDVMSRVGTISME